MYRIIYPLARRLIFTFHRKVIEPRVYRTITRYTNDLPLTPPHLHIHIPHPTATSTTTRTASAAAAAVAAAAAAAAAAAVTLGPPDTIPLSALDSEQRAGPYPAVPYPDDVLGSALAAARATALVHAAPSAECASLPPALRSLVHAAADARTAGLVAAAGCVGKLASLLTEEPSRSTRQLLVEALAALVSSPEEQAALLDKGGVSGLFFCARTQAVPLEQFDLRVMDRVVLESDNPEWALVRAALARNSGHSAHHPLADPAKPIDAVILDLCELLMFLPVPQEHVSTAVDREFVGKSIAALRDSTAHSNNDSSSGGSSGGGGKSRSFWSRVSSSISVPWSSEPDETDLDFAILRLLGDYAAVAESRSVLTSVPAKVLILVLDTINARLTSTATRKLIARIVANMAIDAEFGPELTGALMGSPLFVQLVRWSRSSSEIELKLQALRALSNLHRPFRLARNPDRFVSAYHDEVYVMHPLTATETLIDPLPEDAHDPNVRFTSSGLDIVFVHGLRGHPLTTWRTYVPPGAPPSNTLWPLEWLPHDLEALVDSDHPLYPPASAGSEHTYTESELVSLTSKTESLFNQGTRAAALLDLWISPVLDTVAANPAAAAVATFAPFWRDPADQIPHWSDADADAKAALHESSAAPQAAQRKRVRITDARILSIGFDSNWSEWSGTTQTLEERADVLLDKLQAAGIGRDGRRVLFVAHSMGGLLIKQALVFAESHAPSLLARTAGIVFYATPHFGSLLPYLVVNYATAVYKPSRDLVTLQMGSQTLRYLNELMARFSHIPIVSIGEELPLPIPPEQPRSFIRHMVVPPESAYPGYGHFVTVPADHLNVCKPESRSDAIYTHVITMLRHILHRQDVPPAPSV